MRFSFALLAAVVVPSALAAPVPVPQSDANTGLGSLLNGDLTKSRLEVVDGLKSMSDALSSLASGSNAQVAQLAKTGTTEVQRAQAGVDTIGQNIIAGNDPNTGNNPQGEVAAGIVAANKTVSQISAIKGTDAQTISSLQDGLKTAIAGGEGVLKAQGKSLNQVLDANGNPKPVAASAPASSDTGASSSTGSTASTGSTSSSTGSSAGGLGDLAGILKGLGLKAVPIDCDDKAEKAKRQDLAGLLGNLGGGDSPVDIGKILGGLGGDAQGAGGDAGGLGGILGSLTGGAGGGAGGLGSLIGGGAQPADASTAQKRHGADAATGADGADAGGLDALSGILGGGADSPIDIGKITSGLGGAGGGAGGLDGLLSGLTGATAGGGDAATGAGGGASLAGLLGGKRKTKKALRLAKDH